MAWVKGQSGNPKGRRVGSGELGRLRAGIGEHVPEIIASLVTAAKAGDTGAARLLLERVLPALKPEERPAPVALAGEGLVEQGRSVIDAVARGELATGQAAHLLAGLGALARLVEVDELADRIEALEAKVQAGGATP